MIHSYAEHYLATIRKRNNDDSYAIIETMVINGGSSGQRHTRESRIVLTGSIEDLANDIVNHELVVNRFEGVGVIGSYEPQYPNYLAEPVSDIDYEHFIREAEKAFLKKQSSP